MFSRTFRLLEPVAKRRPHRVSRPYRPVVEELENRVVLSLVPLVSMTGKISLSLDGAGTVNPAGRTIRVQKPAGATVLGAYLAAASTGFTNRVLANGDVTLNGVGVNWSVTTPSTIGSSNSWADVTAIVKPVVDAAPAGIVTLAVTEVGTPSIDGESLSVVFNDPNQATTNTVAILFGAQNVAGDTFGVKFGSPINTNDPNLLLDMSLGISYGFQSAVTTDQFSIVNVNGTRLTTSAGGQDDGESNNGALITVGGIGDADTNPANPLAQPGPLGDRSDDELYNLVPFVRNGDTSLSIFTQNPSNDDNIFQAAFFLRATTAVVGEGILLTPPTSTQPVGSSYTATATLQDNAGNPLAGRTVAFRVTSGPQAGLTGNAVTDAAGHARFTYTGLAAGSDTVVASFVNSQGKTVTSNAVTSVWTPSAAPLKVACVPIRPIAGAPFSGVVATFTDADGDPLSHFTATITWGDGTTTTGTIASDGKGGFTVSGGHTYATPHSSTMSVQINDTDGASASANCPLSITVLGSFATARQTATVNFWNGPRGQALLTSFNGGSSSTALSSWLTGFANLWGATAGPNNLSGKTNAQVAAFFQSLAAAPGPKADAEALALALNIYATTLSLGGTAGTAYGFNVTATGLGASLVALGLNGPAFDSPNNVATTAYRLLQATNAHAVNGVLYNGDSVLLQEFLNVIASLNGMGINT